MINYRAWVRACKELKLDPTKFGDNPFVDGHPSQTFSEPFDFDTISFPKKELEQVLRIGQIIYNLESQLTTSSFFDLTNSKGKANYQRYNNIKKIVPFLVESLNFWLDSGLKKSKSKNDLIIYNGRVFEIDPNQTKKMKEMNFFMNEVHKDYLYKNGMSEKSTSEKVLN